MKALLHWPAIVGLLVHPTESATDPSWLASPVEAGYPLRDTFQSHNKELHPVAPCYYQRPLQVSMVHFPENVYWPTEHF